jgi:membrane protease YdiL (CAAX protease family)
MIEAATCRGCSAAVPAGARFCGSCGRPVGIRRPPRGPVASRANDAARDWMSVRGALALFGIILLTMLPLAWLPRAHAATGMLVIGLIDAVVVAIAMRQMRGFVWSRLFSRRIRPVMWLLAAFGLGVALACNVMYHRVAIALLGITPTNSLGDAFHDAGYSIAITVLCICVQPAIVEEIAFRGIIQTRLVRVVTRTEALLITAFAFGIIHMSWVSLPYLAAFGLFLGWLRQRSGSLVPSMVVHGVHNLVVVAIGTA